MREAAAVAACSAALYLTLAVYLVTHEYLFGDTVSRVANGSFVLFSRDPHLAAVGFVWSPLPSLAAMPLLLLKPLFPALSSLAFAGNLESVACGAVATGLLDALLAEIGVARRWVRLLLLVAFVLHPAQLLLFADGATEAMQLMWMLVAALGLARWLRRGGAWNLVLAGMGLGLVYLTRYEGAPAAATVTLLVGIVSWQAERAQARRDRLLTALNDMLLVAMPFLLSFGSWALASKLIVGHWFEQFTSEYGNSAQAEHANLAGAAPSENALHILRQVIVLEPLGAVLVALTLVLAVRRRSWLLIAPVLTLLPLAAFDFATTTAGLTFPWLRFQAVWVPISVLAAGAVVAGLGSTPRRGSIAAGCVAVALALGLPASLPAFSNGQIDPEGLIWHPHGHPTLQWRTQREIAGYLDRVQERTGKLVLLDASREFSVLLASEHQGRYVIQNDRDFQQVMQDPKAHDVGYVLVSSDEPALNGPLVRRFPGLYENGAGIATLDHEWQQEGKTWRVYRFD